jgi:hypothetical protein
MAFLFVLLIILVNKSPRTGAWLIGGLVFAVPILLYRVFRLGAVPGPATLPLIVVPAAFLFVLLIILLTKAPKVGAGLIVALLVMGLLGIFFATSISHRPPGVVPQARRQPPAVVPELPPAPTPPASATPAPIWSEAVETQFDADVYPSQLAAVRAMGLRMDKTIRELVKDVNSPRIVLFQESRDPGLLAGLKNAIQEVVSDLPCGVEAEVRNIRPNEIGIELDFHNQDMQPAPWARSNEVKAASGLIELQVSTAAADRRVFSGRFVEKPWIENFATFASNRPRQAFIIARSLGTCTSEGEANQQALDDARVRLTEAIGQRGRRISDKLPKPEITATDVLQGGFIVDRFAQGFEGSVGKVWRQALLIDVSGPKLAQLAGKKAREFREAKMTWARMGLSAVGVVVLIGVIYFFLNMATMGYYEWSLRIASVVLAIVGVLSILMVVH